MRVMDGRYRLVFSGEILEGQHRAVVRRRLAEALKLDDAQAQKLFSGSPVTLKKEVDAAMAARYQALFKKAGARLRVLPLRAGGQQGDQSAAPSPRTAAPESTPSPASAVSRDREAPVRGENSAGSARASTLSVVAPDELEQRLKASAPAAADIEAPDFSVADPGAVLGARKDAPPPRAPDPDFSLADVGADLLEERPEAPTVALGPLEFEVAEVGATMGDTRPRSVPAAPDTSHISLAEDA